MIPMMVDFLVELRGDESETELTAVVEEYVAHLTGKQTIYQMIELAKQISFRGGKALDPMIYKHMYLERLDAYIKLRVEGLESGTTAPDTLMVPGSRRLLKTLKERGLCLYLAVAQMSLICVGKQHCFRLILILMGTYMVRLRITKISQRKF